MKRPLIIGVTGGIASGKSTVARMIAGRGIAHLDADRIVHHLMRQDRTTINAIAAAFPAAEAAGAIDRSTLAAQIADHPGALKTLEHILHPRVRSVEQKAIRTARRNRLRALVLDIPLLFETDAHLLCDVVIVVHAPLQHRRRRAFTRTGMTELKWQKLLARQLLDHRRHPAADHVIDTSAGKGSTRRQLNRLLREWGLC